MDSDGKKLLLGVILRFLYQMKELEILFLPRRYNLMSENNLD